MCQRAVGTGVGVWCRPRESQSNRPTVVLSRAEEDGPIPDVGGIPINIDPTLFRWEGLPLQITWHGFFTAVGTLVGIWVAVRWATRAGFTEDDTFSVAMWGVIGADRGRTFVPRLVPGGL